MLACSESFDLALKEVPKKILGALYVNLEINESEWIII